MSTRAASLPVVLDAAPTTKSGVALIVGLVGIVLTAIGWFISGRGIVANSWLIGITFWTGIALGMLLLVMIHYIFDASWSTVLRRQFEHGLSAFPYLFLLFVPLIVIAWTEPTLVWKWMDPHYDLSKIGGHGLVGDDVLWVKKSGFLSLKFFTGCTIISFVAWIFLSSRFRRNSFSQDNDGDIKWTISSRKWSAAGIPIAALTLTACVILWVKSLEYHWFSTMYGVWFFANCVRGALSIGVLIMVWLYARGDYKGVLNNNHFHSIGQLMFAFTVFWAYVTFSQYFLIWNANVPEETFWYNLREINNSDGQPNQWKWVGMTLLFGHFFLPFFFLLSYKHKVVHSKIRLIAIWIALIFLLDICYNVMPTMKNALGDPFPFLQSGLIWTITSVIGIGGICIWAYLKSFVTAKLIPIRDPRIVESLTHHE